ncbi:hypothetical protein GOAMR_34_00760 [Gordonia amarae NBRC 15530]|uniref:N-acetyltransferase domain-containing protein n=1 Tax=Gordonia amarae NBRC 15530 TaxID=1075090 RepID=G7GP84_9ACTN|nr:hypothetical protein GOAMR_34_00760 [Gordonia amarae NBRC 15530]
MRKPRTLSPKHSSAMRRAAGREPSRVQTPEGEKKFGQKIGEIIRPDGMKPRDDPATKPDVAAKAKSTKVKPVAARNGSAHMADVATKAVAAQKAGRVKRAAQKAGPVAAVAAMPKAVNSGGDRTNDHQPIPDTPRLGKIDLAAVMRGDMPLDEAAEKMSGKYGPFWARFNTLGGPGTPMMRKVPFNAYTERDGSGVRTAFGSLGFMDVNGDLVVDASMLNVDEDYRRQGFGEALQAQMLEFFIANGVDRVEVMASMEDGGAHWAQNGVDFDGRPDRLGRSVAGLLPNMAAVRDSVTNPVSEEGRRAIYEIADRMRLVTDASGNPVLHADFPTPREIRRLATSAEPDLGDRIMRGSTWYGVLSLR